MINNRLSFLRFPVTVSIKKSRIEIQKWIALFVYGIYPIKYINGFFVTLKINTREIHKWKN